MPEVTRSVAAHRPRTAEQHLGLALPAEGARTARFRSMGGPKPCSMKIAQEVRGFAAKQNVGADAVFATEQGMAEMSERFLAGEKFTYLE